MLKKYKLVRNPKGTQSIVCSLCCFGSDMDNCKYYLRADEIIHQRECLSKYPAYYVEIGGIKDLLKELT
jgi:hypothetical protein